MRPPNGVGRTGPRAAPGQKLLGRVPRVLPSINGTKGLLTL